MTPAEADAYTTLFFPEQTRAIAAQLVVLATDARPSEERDRAKRALLSLDPATPHDSTIVEPLAAGAGDELTARGLPLVAIGALFAAPETSREWLAERLLGLGALSLVVAKPKVGKSTLARGLCAAVAMGEPWLGAAVLQGPVIYCGFEEKCDEVREHFRALGVGAEAPLHVYSELPPFDAISRLGVSVKKLVPRLVVLDGLFRIMRVSDASAYAEVSGKLEPFLRLARESRAHLLLTHHAGKADRGDGDSVLGSTALFGSVDTLLTLKRSERYRTLAARQRYGEDLPETVIAMEVGTRRVILGNTRERADETRSCSAMLEALNGATAPMTEPELITACEGRPGPKRRALRELVADGQIERLGAGHRGDPFLYQIRGAQCWDRESENENRGNENPLSQLWGSRRL